MELVDPFTVVCYINDQMCASHVCDKAGAHKLAGVLPAFALHEPILQLIFEVAHTCSVEVRDLGVCVELDGSSEETQIPFQVL